MRVTAKLPGIEKSDIELKPQSSLCASVSTLRGGNFRDCDLDPAVDLDSASGVQQRQLDIMLNVKNKDTNTKGINII